MSSEEVAFPDTNHTCLADPSRWMDAKVLPLRRSSWRRGQNKVVGGLIRSKWFVTYSTAFFKYVSPKKEKSEFID